MSALLLVGTAAAQDPSDAYLPTVRVGVPNLSSQEAKLLSSTFTVEILGADPDADSGLPAQWRMLMTSAQYGGTAEDPLYVRTPYEYEQYGRDLVAWDHPDWSPWIPYSENPEDNRVTFPNMPDQQYYLFALQVMDEDGAVSIKQGYNLEVMNFRVRAGVYAPEVTLCEPFLGCQSTTSWANEIASGQPLNFSWTANADAYAGQIVSYRHGWDLADPNDPNDPGWSVPPGLEPENLFAPERAFQEGYHRFYLQVTDDSSQVRLMTRDLEVIPFVAIEFQYDLMVIDQTIDNNSNRWPDIGGTPQDNGALRNEYWSFLAGGSGGVSNINWERDFFEEAENVSYSDVVKYRAVLCFARLNDLGQGMFRQFRAVDDVDKYVWLTPYQERGGNFFLVGDRSMESFIEVKANYMIPTIFQTNETVYFQGGTAYEIGFGQAEMPDGSMVDRGTRMYPYATAGIAAVDWNSTSIKTIYARPVVARFDRNSDCVGLKAIALDPDFRSFHGVAPGAIADTIYTSADIDWQDPVAAAAGTLELFPGTFYYRDDEFFDANISSRPTAIYPQDCLGAPGDKCVQPMWRGVARMDWMREYSYQEGDPDWPHSEYSPTELEDGCGEMALTSFGPLPMASARTNDQVYGFMSWKMVDEKPSGKADVYWGFDPYRFDHAETKKAVRWVLGYFGLNINP